MRPYYPASFYGTGETIPQSGISRRQMLHSGVLSAAGLALASRLCAEPTNNTSALFPQGKAKAVIQIWMWGGPSHTDTFDPKPEAGNDYTGPLKGTAQTNVPGMHIGELLPELAKLGDKFSIIRSMTHGQNGHETASYLTQTGRMPGRIVYPAVGAVVTAFKGFPENVPLEDQSLIPPYVVLTQPQGRFSEAGFMGIKYKPFATGGDPNAGRFVVEGIVAPGISDEQQLARRRMLEQVNTLGRTVGVSAELDTLAEARKGAYDLMLGDSGKVFDLSQEQEETRLRYGRTTFGQSCLVARRLVEQGVKYVTINYGGWDTHKDHFQSMRRNLPVLDRGMSSLLTDLSDSGLLDSTIVWWTGEFGRTPKVDYGSPWNGGRHHYGRCFSSVVAGGGFRGGMVVGESDSRSETVKDRPVYPCDLIGSMYELLGISPEAGLPHPLGEYVRATPGPDEGLQMGGRLTEIM
ncbi:MAG: DUF1501 domain-containing protein [Planctomycetaceae bacterium]|nr:DUF1501 domain-containing protein [Planctomycetaceae bacterium]